MMKEQMGIDKVIPRYALHDSNFLTEVNGNGVILLHKKGGCTDLSKTDESA
jgi:hypothetical protein